MVTHYIVFDIFEFALFLNLCVWHQVASSDARNISCSMIKSSDGAYYLVNGRKHWTSGAMDPRCSICILMGKTDFEQTQYSQQSMLICPMDLEGVRIVRHLTVFGYSVWSICSHSQLSTVWCS